MEAIWFSYNAIMRLLENFVKAMSPFSRIEDKKINGKGFVLVTPQ